MLITQPTGFELSTLLCHRLTPWLAFLLSRSKGLQHSFMDSAPAGPAGRSETSPADGLLLRHQVRLGRLHLFSMVARRSVWPACASLHPSAGGRRNKVSV